MSALQFPVTVVAKDGWVHRWRDAETARVWSPAGIAKYGNLGFLAADATGSMWRLVAIRPEQPLTLWKRFASFVSIVRLPARIDVEKVDGDPLISFRAAFLEALTKDDDSLTQFHSKEQIEAVVASSKSVPELISRLCRMKIIE